MPHIQSPSRKAFHQNVSEMVRAGYPQKQAVAAAMNTARKNGATWAGPAPKKGK